MKNDWRLFFLLFVLLGCAHSTDEYIKKSNIDSNEEGISIRKEGEGVYLIDVIVKKDTPRYRYNDYILNSLNVVCYQNNYKFMIGRSFPVEQLNFSKEAWKRFREYGFCYKSNKAKGLNILFYNDKVNPLKVEKVNVPNSSIKADDIIKKINGVEVSAVAELAKQLFEASIKNPNIKQVDIEVLRGDKHLTLKQPIVDLSDLLDVRADLAKKYEWVVN